MLSNSTYNLKIALAILTIVVLAMCTGCQNTLKVLEGADYACGNLHIEGYISDSQGEVRVGKIPEGWSAEEFKQVCPQ